MRLTSSGPVAAGRLSTSRSAPSIAVPDADPPVGRLDVDVGGAVAQRLRDDLVDELDDRCFVGRADDGFDLLLGGGRVPELLDVVVVSVSTR